MTSQIAVFPLIDMWSETASGRPFKLIAYKGWIVGDMYDAIEVHLFLEYNVGIPTAIKIVPIPSNYSCRDPAPDGSRYVAPGICKRFTP